MSVEQQSLRVVQPPQFPTPRGYVNGMAGRGELLTIAGQIGWTNQGELVGPDMVGQFAQALENVLAVIKEAGGRPEHLCSMTIFVTDINAYRTHQRELGRVWRERLGRHYPSMALIGVSELVEPHAIVEISALALLPEGEP
jgi:enamine deaminase RidA (YjgF/YER057c/UK114 family)